ncbi:hydantoinase/oxoprolinase family protein [Candidatus Thorarchaeota archaeon]|nr:MAG: hydantoinase/oxoprolinase family protein [Candidatus Thorarchaeota archaeon]
MKLVGVDVGGTFTDIMIVDLESGEQEIHKLPSSASSQDRAVTKGIGELLAKSKTNPKSIGLVVHGTTVATNAMLERKGADVCLITTKGMEDILEIARQNRDEIYTLNPSRPEPLVQRQNRIGIIERLSAGGQVIKGLESTEIDRVVDLVKSRNPDAVAISLLFSFENTVHEQAILGQLKRQTDYYVVASSDVLPEFREYERASTTVLEAYLGPLVVDYVEKLSESLSELCPNTQFAIMQSNGGTVLSSRIKGKSVGLALSGLAGGVIGGWEIAKRENLERAITLDMGGTSCDISAITGDIRIRASNEIGGLPLRTPSVDVLTIGAGGGSIAWIDEAGIMHVGPQSAGAEPGPAAYDKGGSAATVTDATLLAGRINPVFFVGGRMKLRPKLSRHAISTLAKSLGLTTMETALGIIRISTTNMVQAIREMTVLRGHDPRDFVLIPFGGAGPTQAVDIADQLDIRQILVPPRPGITSALGLLVADLRVDLMKTMKLKAQSDNQREVLEMLHALTRDAISQLKAQGAAEGKIDVGWAIDMRYEGQSHELAITIPFETENLAEVSVAEFERQHRREFGYILEDRRIEWITARIIAKSPHEPLQLSKPWRSDDFGATECRAVTLSSGETMDAEIYRRESLNNDGEYQGPMIVEQEDTTIYIAPGWKAKQTSSGSLWIRRG